MSTRATIVLEIPKDKKGKVYQYPNSNNPNDKPIPSVEIPKDDDINYVSVYVHSDGYTAGLGQDLVNAVFKYETNATKEEYKDYDDTFDYVMTNIVAGGDMSYLNNPYYAWGRDTWGSCKPKFYSTIPDISEAFQYLLNESNEWLVRNSFDIPNDFTIF